jgi:hypothetical protein
MFSMTGCDQATGPEKKQSAQVEAEVIFPEQFPSYIPKYPGGKPINQIGASVQNKAMGDLTGFTVEFTTKDSPEKVRAFYKAALEKAGMVEMANQSLLVLDMSIFRKNDDSDETVILTYNKMLPGLPMFQLIYQPTPPGSQN